MKSDNTAASPVMPADERWAISGPTEGPHWPNAEAHTWGEFAGVAVECGGYGDMTMIDPSSGRRLWLGDAFDQTPGDGAFLRALRRLVDLAEATGFLGDDHEQATRNEAERQIRLYGTDQS